MELIIKSISENELEDFLSILKEAALWLKNEDKEMWRDNQLSPENLLNTNSIEELFYWLHR
ncbi:hypothetical protein J2736_001514 [Paenibacillus qinlingensis]|uniref:GNAT family N-acetyltransferase n=1 Tax=Paenibacillus qinlingensis TaxID=1837343 RepID=A0ABU1NS69_9BACL|nr:hypothetical protein [Paenibacillus qinlingensis]